MPDLLDDIYSTKTEDDGGDLVDQIYGQHPAPPSAAETFGEHAAAGIGPGAAFALAAPRGAKWGAGVGAMIPGADVSGVPEAVGAFLGALVTGGIASWGAYKAQHAALKAAAPTFTDEMDKRLAAGSEAHPFASVAGDVVSMLPSSELSVPKLSQIPFRAALGASVGAVQPLLQGQMPTKEDVASAALMASIYGRGRFEKPPTPGAPNASTIPSAARVLEPEVRTPVDEEAPLRQQGATAPAQGAEAIPAQEEINLGVRPEDEMPEQPATPEVAIAVKPGGWYQVIQNGKMLLETRDINEAKAKRDELAGVKPGQMTKPESDELSALRKKDLSDDGLTKDEEQRLYELSRKETQSKRAAKTSEMAGQLKEQGVDIPDSFLHPSDGVENHITSWTYDHRNGMMQIRVERHTNASMSGRLITVKAGDVLTDGMDDSKVGTTRYREANPDAALRAGEKPQTPPGASPGTSKLSPAVRQSTPQRLGGKDNTPKTTTQATFGKVDVKTSGSVSRVRYFDKDGNEIGYGQLDGDVINYVSVNPKYQRKGYGAEIVKDLKNRGGKIGVAGTPEGVALMRSKKVGANEYEPNKFNFEKPSPVAPAQAQAGVKLSAEHQAILDEANEGASKKAAPLDADEWENEEGRPLARLKDNLSRAVMIADKDYNNGEGRILVNPSEFSKHIEDLKRGGMSRDQIVNTIRSMIKGEELAHLAVTDDEALTHWNDKTGIEKAITKRIYSGQWTEAERAKRGMGAGDMTDTLWGHESLASILTRARGMQSREFAEAMGRERVTVKTLEGVEAVIRRIRETFTGDHLANDILDRMQANVGAAKAAIGQSSPAARRKRESYPSWHSVDSFDELEKAGFLPNLRTNEARNTDVEKAVQDEGYYGFKTAPHGFDDRIKEKEVFVDSYKTGKNYENIVPATSGVATGRFWKLPDGRGFVEVKTFTKDPKTGLSTKIIPSDKVLFLRRDFDKSLKPPSAPMARNKKTDYDRFEELKASIKGKLPSEAQAIAAEMEQIKNRNGGMPPTPPVQPPVQGPTEESVQKEIDDLESAAKQAADAGDDETASQMQGMAEQTKAWWKNNGQQQFFPAARRKMIRDLTPEERAALPPVPMEQREAPAGMVPPKAQPNLFAAGELPLGVGPIKGTGKERGEYKKSPMGDKGTPPLIKTPYFRPSGSAAKPVPMEERVGTSEAGALPALPASPSESARVELNSLLNKKASGDLSSDEQTRLSEIQSSSLEGKAIKWLDNEFQKTIDDAKAGKKASLPKIEDLEAALKRATGGRLQEGAAFDMAQRMITARLQRATGEELRVMQQTELNKRLRGKGGVPVRQVPPIADAPAEGEMKTIVQKGMLGSPDEILKPKQTRLQGPKRARIPGETPGQRELELPEEVAPDIQKRIALSDEIKQLESKEESRTLTKDEFDRLKTYRRQALQRQHDAPLIKEGKPIGEVPEAVVRHQDAAMIRARQARRQKVIGYLMDRITRKPLKSIQTALQRTSIKPEDIRFGTEWRYEGDHTSAWQAFDENAAKTPAVLGSKLVDEAGVSGDLPKTVTRRVTAIMDRKSGKVSLVSTYEERGKDVTRLLDPGSGQAKQHSTLESILKRYRVLYSALLDQPVQNFRQDFRDLPDFMDKFGNEAEELNKATQSYQEPPPIEGSPGIHGEGGGFMGPGRETVGEFGWGAVAKSERTPLSDQEATALQTYIDDTLGDEPQSVDDVRDVIDGIGADPHADPAAKTALMKIARIVQRQNPKLDADALTDLLSKTIFEDKNLEKSMKKSQLISGEPEPVVPQSKKVETGGKEIVSGARPRTQPSHFKTGGVPMPVATAPAREPVRLTPEEQAEVERQSQQHAAEAANAKTEKWREQALFPKAVRKFAPIQDAAQDRLAKIGRMVRTSIGSKDFEKGASRARDAATNESNNSARQAATNVRLASAEGRTKKLGVFKPNIMGKKDVLSGANAMLATGAVERVRKYSAVALAERDKLQKTGPTGEMYQNALAMRNPVDKVTGEPYRPTAKQARTAEQLLRSANDAIDKVLLEQGLIDHTGAEYRIADDLLGFQDKLDEFLHRVRSGMERANHFITKGNYYEAYKGRKWMKAAKDLERELEYAKANWNNPELRNTAIEAAKQLDAQFDFEKFNGLGTRYEAEYNPGRYDAEFFTSNGIRFDKPPILGRNFGRDRVFPTYYHAIEHGAYIPLTRDISNIVEHRVRQGMNRVNRALWVEGLFDYKDPVTGEQVVTAAKVNPPGSKSRYSAPSAEYELVHIDDTGMPVAVLKGADARLIRTLIEPSFMQNSNLAANALAVSQWLKHTVLMGDVFHMGRVTYYGTSISGIKGVGWKPGWAALDIPETRLGEAVQKGLISQKTHDWLTEKVPFKQQGQTRMVTRAKLANLFTQAGYNTGRISDAIYKDLVKNVPIFGGYNKFLFDKFTRGMMANSAITEFERVSKANPGKDSRLVMRDIASDLNNYFGSIGRQGWVKSAGWQDLLRMTFLAPQWFEGLVKKEMAMPQFAANKLSGGRIGAPHATAARGIARGLVAMAVLTQVANLITRGQPTWMNKEKEHKWDADVFGVWVSPLSVFNELTHDIIRLNQSKDKTWDAIRQIGENKLGFYGRLGMVLATDKTPQGEYISTTGGIARAAASQLIPTPISFGKPIRAIASTLAPGTVAPNEPGQVMRQTLATIGVKGQVARQPIDDIQKMASKFAVDNGLRPDSVELTATDQPSYAKLRHELFVGNDAGATQMLQQLRQQHHGQPDFENRLVQNMSTWARRPFTGSYEGEQKFIDSLDKDDRQLYTKAQQQRMDFFNQFERWYEKNGRR